MFNISPVWARRVKQRWQQSGERAARPMGGLRVVKIDLQQLGRWVKEQPGATTCELHQRLVREWHSMQRVGRGNGASASGAEF